MSQTTDAPGELQALNGLVASAATPGERAKARLELAEETWLKTPADAAPLLELALSDAREAGDPRCQARAASMLGELLRRSGDLDGSARYAELVLDAADAVGDRRTRASGLNLLGMISQERGEFDRAITSFEQALELSRETGFSDGEESALNQLAGVYALRGELDRALDCYRRCLEVSSRAHDHYGRAINLHNIGWTLQSMGHWAEAIEHFHRTVAICEEHDFHDLLLSAQMQLGELALNRSDCENAALMFSAVVEAERTAQHSGQQLRIAMMNLGWTHFRAGDLAKAEETLDEAARLDAAAEDRCQLACLCCRRAELALAQGRLDAAGDLLAEAERHAAELKLPREQGEVLRVKALLSMARSDAGSALVLFARAEAALKPLGDTYELAVARLQHGRLLAETGQAEEAQPRLRVAAQTFRRLAVTAESEEANRLLYRLEAREDPEAAVTRGLLGLKTLDLAPERFIERALAMFCDSLRFERGAVLVNGRPVALHGQPVLTNPPRRSSLRQTDLVLVLPVGNGRSPVGHVWLQREQPLAERADPRLLGTLANILIPSLARLAELQAIQTSDAPIAGLRFRGVAGRNPEVLGVLRSIPRVAATVSPVLICGESGTGKELVARALHESGPRADGPFVTVNCAAVPESLLEAEFFGVEAGAATGVVARPGKFEQARGGTIFLDEIGDMSPTLQARLLRVIEDHSVTRVGGERVKLVDVRVVAATSVNLASRMGQGLFRKDLFYRLNGVKLDLPPLRQRREDLPALTSYFMARTAQEYGRVVHGVDREVLALFDDFAFPGNIRQLQHAIARAMILAAGDTIQVTDLPREFRRPRTARAARPVDGLRRRRRKVADETERAMLVEALEKAKGNVSEAARLSGYSRAQFYRLLRKHNVNSRP
jgi:DNA-binding NtrC family response regulator/tetratricopeptide (TPR) repeat protein